MKITTRSVILASMLAVIVLPIGFAEAGKDQDRNQRPCATSSADRSAVDTIITEWPARPRLGANMMMAKYGGATGSYVREAGLAQPRSLQAHHGDT